MPLPFAVTVGKFVGAVLSECAPVLEEIAYRAFCRAFKDSAEVGKPNEELQNSWAITSDAGPSPIGMRNTVSNTEAGYGRSPEPRREGNGILPRLDGEAGPGDGNAT